MPQVSLVAPFPASMVPIIIGHVHVVKSGPRLSQVEQGIFGVPNSAPTARAGLCYVARGIIRLVGLAKGLFR